MSDAVYEANLLREEQLVREVDDLRRSLMDSKRQLDAQAARALEAEKMLEWKLENHAEIISFGDGTFGCHYLDSTPDNYGYGNTPLAALTDAWRKAGRP
jgi:adenylate kinase